MSDPVAYRRSKAHAVVHHAATPPPSPAASDTITLLRAWIDAELRHPGDQAAVLALVETAVRRCVDRRAGRVGTHYESIPADVRPLVGRRDGEGLKALLGRWGRDGGFLPGVASLNEGEAEVYWWSLRGWQTWEMQRERTAPALRLRDRALWVSVAGVERDLAAAETKVARVFGLLSDDA